MKKILLFLPVLFIVFQVNSIASTNTFYVSSSGNNSNSGTTSSSPLQSLSASYSKMGTDTEIVLLDATTLTLPGSYNGNLTIKGNSSNIVLTLPSEVSLTGNLKLDNLSLANASTIYANGYNLEIGSSTTSSSRLTVYGGKKSAELIGDTNVILLGGQYQNVYGGGNGGKVNGNTNVVFGGNCNPNDSISDADSNCAKTYIYGGSNNAAVIGKTNVTLQNNAIIYMIYGAGAGTNGKVTDTNIYINGGKAMCAYGGGASDSSLTNCNTHITMAGGLVEQLFGGSYSASMTGTTHVILKGGNVSRRVYSGCYNDMDIGLSGFSIKATWKSSHHVSGTTTLMIYPGISLNTKKELSSDNSVNVGTFAGSRIEKQPADEINNIIYLDNSYSSHKNYIGEKSSKYIIPLSPWLKSFANYTVQCGTGGDVYGTSTGGNVYIAPDEGNCGVLNGGYYLNENAPVSSSASITFEKNFNISSVTATASDTGVSGTITYTARNAGEENNPKLINAVYDDTGKYINCCITNTSPGDSSKTYNIDFIPESGKTYTVKTMLISDELKTLTAMNSVKITK